MVFCTRKNLERTVLLCKAYHTRPLAPILIYEEEKLLYICELHFSKYFRQYLSFINFVILIVKDLHKIFNCYIFESAATRIEQFIILGCFILGEYSCSQMPIY